MMSTAVLQFKKTWVAILLLSSVAFVGIVLYFVIAIFAYAIYGWVIPVYSPNTFHGALLAMCLFAFIAMTLSIEAVNNIRYERKFPQPGEDSNG